MFVLSGSQARIISKTGFVKVPKGFDVVDFLYASCVSSCWCELEQAICEKLEYYFESQSMENV